MTSRTTDNRHTPGPWMHTDIMDGGRIFAADPNRAGKRFRVCDIGPGYRSTADAYMADANARLITAAPDLLKQLQSVYACMEITGDWLGNVDEIRAAIAKATGEESDGSAK